MSSEKPAHTANIAYVEFTDLTVTSADREAATTFWHRADFLHGSLMYQAIRARHASSRTSDEDRLARAFATHRLAGERAARLDGIRLGLRAALLAARVRDGAPGETFTYERHARDIAAAIGALCAEQLAGSACHGLMDEPTGEPDDRAADSPPAQVRYA